MCKYPIHSTLCALTAMASLACFVLGGAFVFIGNWCKSVYETMKNLDEQGVEVDGGVLKLTAKAKGRIESDESYMWHMFLTCTVIAALCFFFACFLVYRFFNLFTILHGTNVSCLKNYREMLAKDYHACMSSSQNPVTSTYGAGDAIADSNALIKTSAYSAKGDDEVEEEQPELLAVDDYDKVDHGSARDKTHEEVITPQKKKRKRNGSKKKDTSSKTSSKSSSKK